MTTVALRSAPHARLAARAGGPGADGAAAAGAAAPGARARAGAGRRAGAAVARVLTRVHLADAAQQRRAGARIAVELGLLGALRLGRPAAPPSAARPQPHTGISGGQMQPWLRARMKRFTMRSSSEWNEITASRPPGASRAKAAVQRRAPGCPARR